MNPDRLERLIAVATEDALDIVIDNLELVDPELHISTGHAFPLESHVRLRLTPERLVVNSIPGGRVMLGWAKPVVRRQFLADRKVRWHSLRHAEDFLFLMELLLHGAKAELVGWAAYRYTRRRSVLSGKKSPYTRAQRSVADQHKAVGILLAKYGDILTPQAKKILAERPSETVVTAAALDMYDALREGRLLDAARLGGTALLQPSALARCVNARFGWRSSRIA
jgi:hypothetical protein